MINTLKSFCENQYIQTWDNKSKDTDRYKFLRSFKQNNYKFSEYLNDTLSVENRRRLTKLRLGCSKLKCDRYLGKSENETCPLCNLELDSTEHMMLHCTSQHINNERKSWIKKITSIFPDFAKVSYFSKVCSILSLTCNKRNEKIRYRNMCLDFIKALYKLRFCDDNN